LCIDSRLDFEAVKSQHLFFTRSVFNKKLFLTLSEGRAFGEYGLLNHRRRTASVLCVGTTPVFLGMLDQKAYDLTVAEVDRLKIKVFKSTLSSHLLKKKTLVLANHFLPSLNLLSQERLQKLWFMFEKKKFRRGEPLFREKDQVDGTWFLK
jgi:CRP-like cAMP-binding protein